MVTSYDERGRVEAFLRYTENLGYDAVYYTYNSANQVLSVRVCDPLRQYATWYGYDANGRVNKMWTLLGANGTGLGTGTPSYPTPLTKPNQEDMQYTYDQMGRVEQMRYLPEDVLTRYRYNERSWLDSMFAIDASSPTDTVFKQRLSRDARGHITGQRSLQMGQTARVESYVYDGLDQLVEWSRGGSTVTYSYDIVGNRTSDNEPGTSRSYTFGDMTRPNKLTAMTAGTKTTSYSYDANGAMTEKLLTDGMVTLLHHKLTYTQGGLVRQFEEILSTPGSITCVAAGTTLDASKRDWRYRYSATGEREQKRLYYSPHGDACGETHAWTYYLLGAGDEQLAVYNGRQTNEEDECENTGRRVHIYAVEYISPGGVASVVTRPDGTKELNLRDHLGSVRTVVKAGLTLAQYDYKPFGKVDWSAGGAKREGYIGKEEDRESLLGDYGVRKYDADIGRFLSVDKLFQQQPGYSPYHYSANDPVNALDPSGLSYLPQQVTSTFYVDDEGTRWLIEDGIPNSTNTGWSRRSVYNSGNWLSDKDAAFMSLVSNYVTMPNQAGQKGMSGGTPSDATYVAPHVIRDVSGALAGFESGRGSYQEPIQMAPVLVAADREQVLPAMSDLDYFVNVTLTGQQRFAVIGGWRYKVDQQGYSTGMIAAVTGTAPTPGIGKAPALIGQATRIGAANLFEQMVLDAAKSGAPGVRIMMGKIKDVRYAEDVWAKMELAVKSKEGQTAVIHWWENLVTGARHGFKFKN